MGIVNKVVLRWREGYIDTLAKMFSFSTKTYEDNKMAEFLDGNMSYTYGSFHDTCVYESSRLKKFGIGAGDKVAILSQNMPNWTVAFFSAVAFGRIAVPILPDSSPTEITNILTHSSSRVLYVSQRLVDKVDKEIFDRLTLVIDIETLRVIHRDEGAYTFEGRTAIPHPDDPAAIIYTSGTTGAAKGVMLSHKNFMTNVKIAYHTYETDQSDRWLSILPMPHTYELSIGVLYPFYVGASVYYLQKPPSTSVLLPALKKVRPTVILSVPLVIEKVYKNSVLPVLNQSKFMKWMDGAMPTVLYWFIGLKLKATFGGKLGFFGIGGSKLDENVEAFLKKARFPYAIGYGMTECAPLICTAGPKETCVGSTGRGAWNVSVRLDNVDPATGEGEIVVRGDNVMMGYYKDAKRTQEAFTEDR
ncbi:MAG: AMP-binding protein, partial [Bacteroidales bacterium]|nr:AMP-binding protein [Bacteroidales bacterium]